VKVAQGPWEVKDRGLAVWSKIRDIFSPAPEGAVMIDLARVIAAYVDRQRPTVETPPEKRATAWVRDGGCWERLDAATGRRIAWVFPEPSRTEWRFETDSDLEHVEPDTAEAQMAEVDRRLREEGWIL